MPLQVKGPVRTGYELKPVTRENLQQSQGGLHTAKIFETQAIAGYNHQCARQERRAQARRRFYLESPDAWFAGQVPLLKRGGQVPFQEKEGGQKIVRVGIR